MAAEPTICFLPPLVLDSGSVIDDIWNLDTPHKISPGVEDLGVDVLTAEPSDEPGFQHDGAVEVQVDHALESKSGKLIVDLPFSTLTQPASHFDGFIPPTTEASEARAITALLELVGPHSTDDDYIEFELDNFSVYIDHSRFPNELRPLQHLSTRSVPCMYFDGVLRRGDTQFYLRKVRFHKLPIGNYGDSHPTIGDQIWILSELNERLGREVYYKLRSPAPEYRRFYAPFLWIADLAKHIIDYCEHRRLQSRRALLQDFKSRFSIWGLRKHRSKKVFEKWHSANRSTDFRGAIVANIEYIWKEAHGLDPEITSWHHVWKEVKTYDYYQPNLGKTRRPLEDDHKAHKGNLEPRTIVTPYVHNLFSHMVFGNLLESTEASIPVEMKQSKFVRETESMFVQPRSFCSPRRSAADQIALVASIEPGDVISTKPDDDATTDTRWKREPSKHHQGEYHWFGLVQKVHQRPYGKRSFDILWLYQPADTPCSLMKYPWENELFLSDHCTCHPTTARVQGDEVLSTHEVEWFGTPMTSAEYFVRQTYVASDCRWASLRREHLVCGDETAYSHESSHEPPDQYRIGDAVLVQTQATQLETFIVECFFDENKTRFARMRRLWRRKDVDKDAAHSAPPNELVYSQQLVEIAVKKIDRRCLVRVFHVDEKIPSPYNRNGTGDAFFITHQEIEIDGAIEYRPLESTPEPLRQGFNPSRHKIQKLQGLDLFCGGGNFGRGIEEGSAVEMRWVNDIWDRAVHTYMANANPRCTSFLGSVDDLLGLALGGDQSVPAPGDVHFISAGSPCPGFSGLTIDKTTGHQRKNQSFVASFASHVDLYRPLYGLLENVPKMVNSSRFRDSCVFSQLVCALVGLGYQVQVMFLDAWAFGSAQNRTRVFLAFTAPGLRMPKAPRPSHSHPDYIPLHRLGIMSNGRPFDSRERVPTPFKFVSVKDAVGDLPDIQDGKADYCVGYPDHRLSIGITLVERQRLQLIPTRPYGMNFSKSWWGYRSYSPVMTASERLLFPEDPKERVKKSSKGWGRIDPTGLIGTIPTTCLPTDARVGRINHWEQNRPVSILEARRAQGFPDHEVVVGTPADQYKIIGNSVSRHIALVLGLAVREAWFGTLFDEKNPEISEATCQSDPDITVQSVEVEEIHGDADVQAESDTSFEDPLTMFTPCSSAIFTPATSESTEPFGSDANRKRSQSLYVLLGRKRQRGLDPSESLRAE
ncbi:S-adenosyl-L-methionine-dependent methyltransferase [Xylariaceae sp. AK1471]|nr:S-adenosyl-L-methionine-dependent methyltransferase [Xylariaceae sp. AK1471]